MFAISGHLLPCVNSYARAQEVYDAAPINKFGTRAIRNKHDTSKVMTKYDDGSIAFTYHNTDLVVWYPNKIILRTYDSRSSAIFADRFLPSGIRAAMVRGEMFYVHNGSYYQPYDRLLKFDLVEGRWTVDTNLVRRFKSYRLDKKRAAEVRKSVKGLLDWMAVKERLTGGWKMDTQKSRTRAFALLDKATDMFTKPVPHDMYSQLADYMLFADSDHLVYCQLYLAAGAVTKEVLPIGSVPRSSPYDPCHSTCEAREYFENI